MHRTCQAFISQINMPHVVQGFTHPRFVTNLLMEPQALLQALRRRFIIRHSVGGHSFTVPTKTVADFDWLAWCTDDRFFSVTLPLLSSPGNSRSRSTP